MSSSAPHISVVVPIYNEEASLPELHERLTATLSDGGGSYELVFVDDGSRDGSRDVLRRLSAEDPHLQVVLFRRNFGQTAAMQAGFDQARGDILIPLDADLQNDPADIPRLVAELDQGYDIVSGWRAKREDHWLRRLPSRLANQLIAWVTGVELHDTGCTLKAYRRDALAPVRLYGQLHRFIPALAAAYGARIGELEVQHHPRRHGTSKYGLGRTTKVVLDLILVKFLLVSLTRPMHAFGRWGLLALVGAAVALLAGLVTGCRGGDGGHCLLLAAVLLGLGAQLLSAGLLGELLTRVYHEGTGRSTYRVEEVLGGEAEG